MSMHKPELWEKYNNFTIPSTKIHVREYGHLIKWKENETILEVGFADGTNTMESLLPIVPEDFKEYIGVEITKEMTEYTRKKIIHPKMKFVMMDICTENIPQEYEHRFDHVFSLFVMHMVQNPRLAFQNIYKMLKPGGQLFFTFFERHPADDAFYNLSKHPKWGKYGHEHMISPFYHSSSPLNEWQKLLNETGFVDHIIEIRNDIHEYPSEENFQNIAWAVNSVMLKIPTIDLDEYKRDYLDEYYSGKRITYSKETAKLVIQAPYKLLIAIASKLK